MYKKITVVIITLSLIGANLPSEVYGQRCLAPPAMHDTIEQSVAKNPDTETQEMWKNWWDEVKSRGMRNKRGILRQLFNNASVDYFKGIEGIYTVPLWTRSYLDAIGIKSFLKSQLKILPKKIRDEFKRYLNDNNVHVAFKLTDKTKLFDAKVEFLGFVVHPQYAKEASFKSDQRPRYTQELIPGNRLSMIQDRILPDQAFSRHDNNFIAPPYQIVSLFRLGYLFGPLKEADVEYVKCLENYILIKNNYLESVMYRYIPRLFMMFAIVGFLFLSYMGNRMGYKQLSGYLYTLVYVFGVFAIFGELLAYIFRKGIPARKPEYKKRTILFETAVLKTLLYTISYSDNEKELEKAVSYLRTEHGDSEITCKVFEKAFQERDDSDPAKLYLVEKLITFDKPEAIDALVSVLQYSYEGNALIKAINVLNSRNQSSDIERFKEVTENTDDKNVFLALVNAMENREEPETVDVLTAILNNCEDNDVLKKVIDALSKSKNPQAFKALRNFAINNGAEEEIKQYVIGALLSKVLEPFPIQHRQLLMQLNLSY